jgi:hypothetical protein
MTTEKKARGTVQNLRDAHRRADWRARITLPEGERFWLDPRFTSETRARQSADEKSCEAENTSAHEATATNSRAAPAERDLTKGRLQASPARRPCRPYGLAGAPSLAVSRTPAGELEGSGDAPRDHESSCERRELKTPGSDLFPSDSAAILEVGPDRKAEHAEANPAIPGRLDGDLDGPDVVEAALARALGDAAAAGRFDVVAQLARALEARRLGRTRG